MKYIVLLLGLLSTSVFAADPFVLAKQGCPMAHCDGQLSDLSNQAIPEQPDGQAAYRPYWRGSALGLGCSGNGKNVACTYMPLRAACDELAEFEDYSIPAMAVYAYSGEPVWYAWDKVNEKSLFNCTAGYSVPLVAEDGGIIATDNVRIIRFDKDGNIVWRTTHNPDGSIGGIPISPVITDSGIIILASINGQIYVYDSRNGEQLAVAYIMSKDLILPADQLPPEYFDRFFITRNTVAQSPQFVNRLYIVSHYKNYTDLGRLFAIDLDLTDPAYPLSIAWSYKFGGPSGASPLVINDMIFFDGDTGPYPEAAASPHGVLHIFGIKDLGDDFSEQWTREVAVEEIPASMARDPVQGFWYYGSEETGVTHLDLNGVPIGEPFDIDAAIAVDERYKHRPFSAMTVGLTSQGGPALIVSAGAMPPDDWEAGCRNISCSTYVVAIDTVSRELIWKVRLSAYPAFSVASQFPIVTDDAGENPQILFNNIMLGGWMIE